MESKNEVIARRILGWKLHNTAKWFDIERGILVDQFEPEKNLDDAMLIVERLKKYGFIYTAKGQFEVCFNDVCSIGSSLPEAIRNASYSIAEVGTISDEWF